jgi:hypothetical protein
MIWVWIGAHADYDRMVKSADTDAVVGMSVHNGYWLGGIERLMRSACRGDFPRNVENEPAIPVATDGGGNAFLLAADGQVWRWDHERQSCGAGH